MNAENELHAMLFNETRYNKHVIPNKPVPVSARYNLQYVHTVNIKEQKLSTTGIFTLLWIDIRLAWSTSSYADIEYIYVPEYLVWHPELIVLNSIDELEKNIGAERPVRIDKYGVLLWSLPAMLSTSCYTIVAFFPFDRQYCNIELASLDYTSDAVNLEFMPKPINLGIHSSQGDWEVVKVRNSSYSIIAGDMIYTILQFKMVLKRLPGHYVMIIIFPTVLTAVLTFVTFFLPLKSGVRVGYILTVVLALVVLLTLLSETMPSSTKYPSVLVIFFSSLLGMAFLLVIFTMFIMRLYNKPKRYIAPNWMHSLVRKVRKLKCRASRINPGDHSQDLEGDRPIEEINSVKKSTTLEPFSSKELAEFFDFFLFIVFTVLYILLLLSYPITMKVLTDFYYDK